MEIIELEKFIADNTLIVVPALWILGTFLKHTPKVQDWTIPWVLLAVGTTATTGILGITIDAVLQGTIVTGVAVLGHQLVKQTAGRGDVDAPKQ